MKLKDLLKESFGIGELPSSKLPKMKMSLSELMNEGKHDAMLDKLADIVKGAKSFMDVGKELDKNKIKYSFSTSMIPMYLIDKPAKIAIVNKKYADGAEREVGDIAIGLMENIEEALTTEGKDDFNASYSGVDINLKKGYKHHDENKLEKLYMRLGKLAKGIKGVKKVELVFEGATNEGRVSAKKLLQSVVDGQTDRVEGIKLSKEMAQSFLDWQRLSPYGKKYGDLPFNMLFKAAFNWGLHRYADKKSKEYKDLEAKAKQMAKQPKGESVTEGASSEEKRIVMLAVRKIAKYRNVDINTAVVDVWRAADELRRDIEKGRVKK